MNTRVCSFCKQELELNDENFASKKNGFQWHCRKCQREYRRKHYLNNKIKYVKKAQVNTKKNVDWLSSIKETLSCQVCGENHKPCLEFHHKDPSIKDGNLSRMIRNSSRSRVLSEIDKCIILCANCHRKVHSGFITV